MAPIRRPADEWGSADPDARARTRHGRRRLGAAVKRFLRGWLWLPLILAAGWLGCEVTGGWG